MKVDGKPSMGMPPPVPTVVVVYVTRGVEIMLEGVLFGERVSQKRTFLGGYLTEGTVGGGGLCEVV